VSAIIKVWKQYTSDRLILVDIAGYKIEFDETPEQAQPSRELSLNAREARALQTEIEALTEKGVIKEVNETKGQFISNVFVKQKKDKNKYRMIPNLTQLNEFVTYRKFKMDTFETALNLITKNCFMTSIDYTDAYYSIAIHPDSKKYLRFTSCGRLYEFQALPNGLSSNL
jgi:hypothetical protein